MNGSGSAPITMDPRWPHGVQQTTFDGGVFRYLPAATCCCRFVCRASAEEARTIPRPSAEASNPTESTVLLIGMESSIDFSRASGQYGVCCRHGPADVHHNSVSPRAI